MKRDMDLIRRIALALSEEGDRPLTGFADVEEETFAAHVQWMVEAGLVSAALSPK